MTRGCCSAVRLLNVRYKVGGCDDNSAEEPAFGYSTQSHSSMHAMFCLSSPQGAWGQERGHCFVIV